ncbi:MAG: DUF1549 domain-containing protein [Planctomycetaceae bacterium]
MLNNHNLRLLVFCLACFLSAQAYSISEPAATEPAATDAVDDVASVVDAHIRKARHRVGVTPADICSDSEFVRRVYLDIAGRIPTGSERETFLMAPEKNRRRNLVDSLLESEDYVHHFADMLDVMLMGRGSRRRYEDRVRYHWRDWLETEIRQNHPWNQMAARILLARPQTPEDRGAVWFLYERKDDFQKIAEAVSPAFLGLRIECAQCHDHMVATEIEQQHYWGLVAFFNRGRNVETDDGPRVAESAIGGFSDFANLEGSSSPNLLTFFQSTTVKEDRPKPDETQVDGDEMYLEPSIAGDPRVPRFSRRQEFVEQILLPHPQLARAFVNRTWAMFMGRGIVHPFDQMDSVHPPSHPELLDYLAQDFRDSNYDVRRLVRILVSTQVYQLSSQRPNGAEDPATFSWAIERPLSAEQLSRSIQLSIRGEIHHDMTLLDSLRDKMPAVMPEQSITSVSEALYLSNNESLNEFIRSSTKPHHLSSALLKMQSNEERIEHLFRTIFGRSATSEEFAAVSSMLEKDMSAKTLNHVAWAMVTSAEFRFNH